MHFTIFVVPANGLSDPRWQIRCLDIDSVNLNMHGRKQVLHSCSEINSIRSKDIHEL